MRGELTSRGEDDVELDALVYRFSSTRLSVSSAAAGGGIGRRDWIVNAEVPLDYSRTDLALHSRELASVFHLQGDGLCMFTAAAVRRREYATDTGVEVEATVGLSHPTWAAGESESAGSVGTINIVAFVPVRLSDGALVNAVATATEAKAQALFDSSLEATGTPSDAVTIVCSIEGEPEHFCGPRSLWGSRLARATHRAVLAGARGWSA
jgi:adenosylcobinamide hydrolase